MTIFVSSIFFETPCISTFIVILFDSVGAHAKFSAIFPY